MTRDEVVRRLDEIGSTYGPAGWTHRDEAQGAQLVRELVKNNRTLAAQMPKVPAAWGPRGELGSVRCPNCGKRGQEHGIVCDHCGEAV